MGAVGRCEGFSWTGRLELELNSILRRRAVSNAATVSVVMPCLLVILFYWVVSYGFILHGIAGLVLCFPFHHWKKHHWRILQLSLKTSSCMGGRNEERFTWCISHFTVTSGCSQLHSPALFTDSGYLCSLWYWWWWMCFASLICKACCVKEN